MKFDQETRCTVMRVYLDKDEYKTLERASNIIDKIWEKLDKADEVDSGARTIYNAIDTIGDSLEAIMGNVLIE